MAAPAVAHGSSVLVPITGTSGIMPAISDCVVITIGCCGAWCLSHPYSKFTPNLHGISWLAYEKIAVAEVSGSAHI